MNHETGESIQLPVFSGSEPQFLAQLLELADQRVDNQVWYAVERQGGAARTICSG